jgi:hypothetical protein
LRRSQTGRITRSRSAGIGTSLHDEISQVSEAELQRELDAYLVGQPDAGRNGQREETP